ncbi:response regulator transcription factor [Actinomyces sp.]|uniref:response regulator transcription factor n=1 Tax=Actinomyces sp. TaxID=29317 RepID=UPI00289A0C8F|nr:response regulator transcription factor [Actinomyces sp.]
MGEEPRGLLLVEDDPRLGSIMQDVLALDWQVELATDLAQARTSLGDHLFAVAVVDRRLPDGDGADLVAWMRARADATPVLILTALGATADKVEGLDAGANDYLVKPFEFDELNARLRALTRDYSVASEAVPVGSWTFYPRRKVIDSPYAGRILLTERESALLGVLAAHPDTAFSRSQLLAAAFSEGDQLGTVDTYVHYVRRKTERGLIETIRGFGYRLGTPS